MESTTFSLVIKCDNAAFHEDGGEQTPAALGVELARILRQEADKLELSVKGVSRGDESAVFDVNGNKVGAWRVA